MGVKRMRKLIAGGGAAIGLFVLAWINAAAGDKSPVPYPEKYRSWQHVKTMLIQPGHALENPFAGIHHVYANELDIADGRVTGEVRGEIVDGARKAELLKQLAREEGVDLQQVIAVGDGANDLPMLSIAGLGIAFRAKPLVKQSAEQSISTLGLDAILYLLGFSDRYQNDPA